MGAGGATGGWNSEVVGPEEALGVEGLSDLL